MFGEFLVKNNVVNKNQLSEGLAKQSEMNLPIGETLVSLGHIDNNTLEKYLHMHLLDHADDLLADPEINNA